MLEADVKIAEADVAELLTNFQSGGNTLEQLIQSSSENPALAAG
jgi:hypothetical protein